MRKPADLDAQIKALQDKAKSLKDRQKTQLGELVLATGGDSLPLDALAGVLLAAVEQAREKPEAVARWTERGAAFFRGDGKQGTRGKRNGAGDPPPGTPGHERACCGGRQPSAIGWMHRRPAPTCAIGPRHAANAPATSSNSAASSRRPAWSSWWTTTAPPCSAPSSSWPTGCAARTKPIPVTSPHAGDAAASAPSMPIGKLRLRDSATSTGRPGRVKAHACAVRPLALAHAGPLRVASWSSGEGDRQMRNRTFHQASIAGMTFEGIISGERPYSVLPDERRRGARCLPVCAISSPTTPEHGAFRRSAGGS